MRVYLLLACACAVTARQQQQQLHHPVFPAVSAGTLNYTCRTYALCLQRADLHSRCCFCAYIQPLLTFVPAAAWLTLLAGCPPEDCEVHLEEVGRMDAGVLAGLVVTLVV
jgi:hypothetical protein